MSLQGTLFPDPWFTALSDTGVILPGALGYFYVSGTAQGTLATTYSDVNLTVANLNPVVADAYGRMGPIYLTPGSYYDFLLKTSAGVTVRPVQTYIPGLPSSSVAGSVDQAVTLGENVTAGQTGYISDGSGSKTAGYGYIGDSSNAYSSTTPVIGIWQITASSGDTGTLRTAGGSGNFVGLVAGSSYFVSTSGAVTTTAPTNFRRLGMATSTTTLALQPTRMATATSQAANDFLYAGTAATPSRVGFSAPGIPNFTTSWAALSPSTINTTLMSDGTNWTARAPYMALLKANSGTNTSATAANVDTQAMTGLTAKDTLLIYYTLASVAQDTAQILLYNSTDSVTAQNLSAATLAAGVSLMSHAEMQQMQSAATAVTGLRMPTVDSAAGNVAAAATYATFTTAWTGSWTLALRHGGVTAGGTFQWAWKVYVIRGQ